MLHCLAGNGRLSDRDAVFGARTPCVLLVVALAACLVAGCRGSAPAPRGVPGPLRLALISDGSDAPALDVVVTGMQARARELGLGEVLVRQAATSPQGLVTALAAQGVRGVAFWGDEAPGYAAAMDRATRAGLSVVACGSPGPEGMPVSSVDYDHALAARRCAALLVQLLGKQAEGPVGILVDRDEGLGTEQALMAAKDYLSQNAGRLEDLPPVPCGEDAAAAAETLREFLRKRQDLVGLIILGSGCLRAAPPGGFAGLTPHPPPAVALCTDPTGSAYLRAGYLEAQVVPDYRGLGARTAERLRELARGERTQATVTRVGLSVVRPRRHPAARGAVENTPEPGG
jgi:ABC-type sugar transport system substrate-binding protein